MLDILATFLVDEVEVEDTLANGQKFIPQPVQEKKWQTGEKDKTFVDFYLEAVQQYQKHFQQWQAGYTVNVTEIRKLLLPLCGKIVEKPQFIFTLHKLNKKEEYIYHHAVSVSLIAAFLAKKLAYSIEDWIEVALAGAFVDIGMSQLPTKILTKSGKLTAGEF